MLTPGTRGWEILNPQRLTRPQEKRIEWRVSLRTRMRFRDLLSELVDLEQEVSSGEVSLRMEALREEIRALPGFPRRFDPERDTIVPVTTSAQR